jgi:hypothetical protein
LRIERCSFWHGSAVKNNAAGKRMPSGGSFESVFDGLE